MDGVGPFFGMGEFQVFFAQHYFSMKHNSKMTRSDNIRISVLNVDQFSLIPNILIRYSIFHLRIENMYLQFRGPSKLIGISFKYLL